MSPKKSYEQISEWERIYNKREKMIEDNFYLERTEKLLKEYRALDNKFKDLTYRKNIRMNNILNALNATKPIDEKRKEAEKIKNIAAEKIQKAVKVHRKKKAVATLEKHLKGPEGDDLLYNPKRGLAKAIMKRKLEEPKIEKKELKKAKK